MIYTLCLILIFVGIYSVATKRNTVKIILGVVIMECGLNLLIILLGYRRNGVVPVFNKSGDIMKFVQSSVDPLSQALVLATIVIGLGVIILLVAISIRLYERFGTFDISKIRRLRG